MSRKKSLYKNQNRHLRIKMFFYYIYKWILIESEPERNWMKKVIIKYKVEILFCNLINHGWYILLTQTYYTVIYTKNPLLKYGLRT